jgi:hypothetical protein
MNDFNEIKKVCLGCGGNPKPLSEFYKNSKSRDGRTSRCKLCILSAVTEYRNSLSDMLSVQDQIDKKKVCRRCGGDPMPLKDFYSDKSSPDGHRSSCKKCVLRAVSAYQQAHPEKVRARSARYLRKKKPKGMWSEVGVTELFEVQGNKCAICGISKEVQFGVERDKTTGEIRGVCCVPCIRLMGLFRYRMDLIKQALAYLEGVHVR